MSTPSRTRLSLPPTTSEDFEALVAIRIEAMRESLERIGRFDPRRARERFRNDYSPVHTRHIEFDGERVGFVVVKPLDGALLLDHLYLRPSAQARGIGAMVLAQVFAEAESKGLSVRVGALRESDANRFYARHGFRFVEQGEFDNYYVRPIGTESSMHASTHTPAESVLAYIRAKDGNRPHLLDAAFLDDATLQMNVRTASISFPASVVGRDAIADTLVRRFNQTYENVYTLCIGPPPAAESEVYSCDWLVVMSEKQGGAVRIGCGRYDWSFATSDRRVRALTITIEAMEILPSEALAAAMNWVSALPYPWCDRQTLTAAAPNLPGVRDVLERLMRDLV